ncbi:MAG TPA: metal-sulfur cluster assembly factor [Limnochordia bacterium]|nr:metal-sulfur cluster assembly factor [Limnochordia bacterium]
MADETTPGAEPAVAPDVLEEQVREALRSVIDPELGQNVVDLGLIYGIDVVGDHVNIVMTLTTPGCPASGYLERGVMERAWSVKGVGGVDVELTWMPRWSPEMMSDEAKRRLGFA